MPLVSKTFDQLLDFTRTTSGTFVGSDGLIQLTPASVNLLTFTQQFDNAAWTKSNATVTANATIAPDGTFTADKLVETTATATHSCRNTATVTASTTYTLTVYAKAGERTWIAVDPVSPSVSNNITFFNLSNGTIGTSAAGNTAAITDAGNGWYRCTVTRTTAVGQITCFAQFAPASADNTVSYLGDGTSGLFLWGAQFELGSTVTTYTRNNGGVYPPRFDYDPTTLAPKGILIEEQRVNLLTYSAQFDNAAWTKTAATVTTDATTAPDGTTTADRIVPSTASVTNHRVQISPSYSAATYSVSVYAKADGYNWLKIRVGAAYANFNVSSGVTGLIGGTTISSNISSAGNGWYRCNLIVSSTGGDVIYFYVATTNNAGLDTDAYAGDGTSGIFIWGAQLETGGFATSYIPTVASQVTRARDQCSIVAPNFAPWYNQSEGTLSIEASVSPNVDSGSGNFYAAISDGTSANAINIVEINGTLSQIVTGGVTQFSQTVGAEPTGILKAALAYKTNDVISCVDGTLGALDTSVTLPTVTSLLIGIRGDASGATSLNGHIRSIRYYPVRLSDAQLQALTA